MLAKVGAAGSVAMTSISAWRSARASSKAAGNSSVLTWSHGGTPPYGPVHGASIGFLSALDFSSATFATAVS